MLCVRSQGAISVKNSLPTACSFKTPEICDSNPLKRRTADGVQLDGAKRKPLQFPFGQVLHLNALDYGSGGLRCKSFRR